MNKIDEIISMQGASGTTYKFHLYDLVGELPDFGTVYALVRQSPAKAEEKSNDILYIGNTDNLQLSLKSSDSKKLIKKLGANFVAVHQDSSHHIRQRKSTDLVSKLSPVGNS